MTAKGHKGTFCGDVNVLHLDFSGNYVTVGQDSTNNIENRCILLLVNYASINLNFKNEYIPEKKQLI